MHLLFSRPVCEAGAIIPCNPDLCTGIKNAPVFPERFYMQRSRILYFYFIFIFIHKAVFHKCVGRYSAHIKFLPVFFSPLMPQRIP